ncbi:MAG: hypothetical protein A2W91_03680 [Bacteroidetes bacterium GWF2_38_335]|nr:MAG: hypothetical protein A2W91_03680 [Bacteroidetes bacterium GWF2_38_335]OFY77416.1 MAG: hypothetical protein A2281_01080 [Bacteroidetes bacterium RIFOXYA12_FULL_38_20]HBS87296.1 phosphatase [Bacteroidales bacterium]
MKIAVIDLGTNTFNLLVAELNDNKAFDIVFRHKIPVKLGQGGINQGLLMPDAIERGINAIEEHLAFLKKYHPDKLFAYATSAIRSASNKDLFISELFERFNLNVTLISGDEEAELIYHGVRNAVKLSEEKVLIIDIGGGSIEFIIANNSTIFWKKSYKIGIARLIEKFRPSDPISDWEISMIEQYFSNELNDFFDECEKHPLKTLIGSSGSFDSFVHMIKCESDIPISKENEPSFSLPRGSFEKLYEKLILSTVSERIKMPGLEAMRVEMIVVAALLVKFITKNTGIQNIIQSDFSLKEGTIFKLLSK